MSAGVWQIHLPSPPSLSVPATATAFTCCLSHSCGFHSFCFWLGNRQQQQQQQQWQQQWQQHSCCIADAQQQQQALATNSSCLWSCNMHLYQFTRFSLNCLLDAASKCQCSTSCIPCNNEIKDQEFFFKFLH